MIGKSKFMLYLTTVVLMRLWILYATVPPSEIQKAFLNITTRVNSGFIKTFDRRSVIVINRPITLEEFVNVFNHEKNHLEMHICDECKINPHSEEAAELSGNLAKCLFSSLLDELLFYYTDKTYSSY